MKAAVLAHPDDESLFCAGLLMQQPEDWTVICCSIPSKDTIRAYKFFDACDRLGVRARLMPFVEILERPLTYLDQIDLTPYELVLTHNEVGDYGHPHHKQVHTWVMENFKGPKLTIGYGLHEMPDDVIVDMDDEMYERKMSALRCYNHQIVWGNRPWVSWQALLKDYSGRFNLQREYYKHVA